MEKVLSALLMLAGTPEPPEPAGASRATEGQHQRLLQQGSEVQNKHQQDCTLGFRVYFILYRFYTVYRIK